VQLLRMRRPRLVALLAVAIVSLALAAGCGFVSGSGNVMTKQLARRGFTRVEVGDSFRVLVSEGAAFAVQVAMDDNLFQYLEADVEGDTLRLGLKDGNSYGDATLSAAVTLPELREIQLSGASEGRMWGFNRLQPLRVALSGDSSLKVVDLRSTAVDMGLSGSSDLSGTWVMTGGSFELSGDSEVRLTGAADTLSLGVSGSSTCELARFRVGDLQTELSGSSDGTVHVTGTLDAKASGASVLEYLGYPTIGRIETSGSSEVRPAE
jgi:hypothetical protein